MNITMEQSAFNEMLEMIRNGCTYELTENALGETLMFVETPKGYHRIFMCQVTE